MKKKTWFILAGALLLLAAALIVLVRFADAAAIGPEGTSIGLSHVNGFFFGLFGVNMLWYHVTDWLGIAAILTAGVFAVLGLVQLIKRRSIKKVDREILLLGGLYVVVIGLYLLFEKAIVNYRPIIMPGAEHPEASFPSSHTMLVCVIMGSAIPLTGKYVKPVRLSAVLKAVCGIIIAVTVIGRLISGVHWFTDIVGGVVISAALLSLYFGLIAPEGRLTPSR